MRTRNAKAGPRQGRPAETVVGTTSEMDRSRRRRPRQPIVVTAVAYPPAGRRSMWLLLVLSCPFCAERGVHAHRGARYGGLRRAGCRRGEYLVTPISVRGAVAA